MLRRLQNFGRRFSRLQLLKNNFNRWIEGPNAAALRREKMYNKNWGEGYITKYKESLERAIATNNHTQASNFERQWKNMKLAAREAAARKNRDPYGRLDAQMRGLL